MTARPNDVLGVNKTGCPLCLNKTAAIVYKALQAAFPNHTVRWEAAVSAWLVNELALPFDVAITDNVTGRTVLVEVDGRQYFLAVA